MQNAVYYFLSFFVEAVILYQYTSTLFISKNRTRIRLVVLCGLYSFLFAVSMLSPVWLNAFMYLFANFIFLLTQYVMKWHLALFHSAILTAVMGICELTVYVIMSYFTPGFHKEKAHFHHMLIFSVFSKMIFFTVIYIFTHFMKNRRESNRRRSHSTLLLFLFFSPF